MSRRETVERPQGAETEEPTRVLPEGPAKNGSAENGAPSRRPLSGLSLPRWGGGGGRDALRRMRAGLEGHWPAILVGLAAGVAFVLAAFVAESGARLGPATGFEAIALVAGLGLCALAALRARQGPLWGAGALAAFAVLFLFSGLSVVWSLVPDVSWQEANRTLAYLAVFAGGVAAVRLAPERWTAILYGLLAGLALVSLYGLLSKVFPATLAEGDSFARVREPFAYWNAVGLTGALGVVLALWLGSRREARTAEQIAAVPLVALFGSVLLMSLSRGSLVALAGGLALWLALVPLRLRSLSILGAGAAIGVAVFVAATTQEALTTDQAALTDRSSAGTVLGLVLLGGLVLSVAAGRGILWARDRFPVDQRLRVRIGRGLAIAGAVAAIGGTGAFLATGGGPGERLDSLTAERAPQPANEPGRLASAANIRGAYWRDAGRVWSEHRVLGAGAGAYDTVRLRHRRVETSVRHAHGYVPQTIADLGLIGLTVSLVLLGAFLAAARRPLGLVRGEALRSGRERTGMVAIGALVLAYGIHSTLDWTWFVPALSLAAIFLAGWLAGRGPLLGESATGGPPAGRNRRIAVIGGAAVLGVVGLFAILQPDRADRRADEALALADRGNVDAARAAARDAADMDPLSAAPLLTLAAIEEGAQQNDAAERALIEAVRLQPANPRTWEALGRFRLETTANFQGAEEVLAAALYLDPLNPSLRGDYVRSVRALTQFGPQGTPGQGVEAGGALPGDRPGFGFSEPGEPQGPGEGLPGFGEDSPGFGQGSPGTGGSGSGSGEGFGFGELEIPE